MQGLSLGHTGKNGFRMVKHGKQSCPGVEWLFSLFSCSMFLLEGCVPDEKGQGMLRAAEVGKTLWSYLHTGIAAVQPAFWACAWHVQRIWVRSKGGCIWWLQVGPWWPVLTQSLKLCRTWIRCSCLGCFAREVFGSCTPGQGAALTETGLDVMLWWVSVSFARPSKGKSFPHRGLQPGEQKTPVKLHFLLHIHNLLEQVPLHHRSDLCVLYIYCSLLHKVSTASCCSP